GEIHGSVEDQRSVLEVDLYGGGLDLLLVDARGRKRQVPIEPHRGRFESLEREGSRSAKVAGAILALRERSNVQVRELAARNAYDRYVVERPRLGCEIERAGILQACRGRERQGAVREPRGGL